MTPLPQPESEALELSVVIPALNEEASIGATLSSIRDHLKSNFETWEIIVVDDGSRDATANVVESQATGGGIRLLRNESSQGKGAAVRQGILASRLNCVLFSDADLSMPIEEVGGMLQELEQAQIVIASKRCPGSTLKYPLNRRILGAIGRLVIHLLVVRGVSDTQGGFKLFHGPSARTLFAAQRLSGFGFDFEVLYLAQRFGMKIKEVPFKGRHRLGGSVSMLSYVRTLREVLQFLFYRARGVYPRRDSVEHARNPSDCS